MFPQLTEIIDSEPHGGALNMAIDEVLLRAATTPLLRIYRWARPAVSFGYFGDFRAVAARWPARELVRRWTGGGEVPHGDDVTYTLIVPRSHPFARVAAVESYRAIHACLAPLLHDAVLAQSAGAVQSRACFENAARFDLVAGNRKIAGAAQRRTADGLLHQGSIQAPAPMQPIRAQFAPTLGSAVTARALRAAELEMAHALAAAKYATPQWLHRFDGDALRREQTIPCATGAPC